MDVDAVDELRALRARAYGPDADIHADATALQRLLELERRAAEVAAKSSAVGDAAEAEAGSAAGAGGAGGAGGDAGAAGAADVAGEAGGAGVTVEPGLAVDAPRGNDAVDEEHATADAEPEGSADASPWASVRTLWERLQTNWRATLWAATLIVVLIAAWAATSVIQRVQADPLQVGARQVARLSVDPRFEMPAFFGTGSPNADEPQGFDEFYGLRAALPGWFVRGTPPNACVAVFESEKAAEATANSYSGQVFSGCGAGLFPAAVQFTVTSDFPDELLREFPEGTALQFVLDEDADEVVVFSDAE